MKAAVVHSLGQPPRYEDFPDPVVQENEWIVEVRAASIKNIDKAIVQGTHYTNPGQLPVIAGVDGVVLLADGRRVYTGGSRKPYGMMAEKTVIRQSWMAIVPDALDDLTAAAIPNPALSAWLPLAYKAKLQPGETVWILGATGVSGKLAIQIARLLGASRVVAVGRNESVLSTLAEYGADTTISLNQPTDSLIHAFREEAAHQHVDVVLDYLWGPPTEALLSALTGHKLEGTTPRTRLIEIGQMAGPVISLNAQTLRSSSIELSGSGAGGSFSMSAIMSILPQVMDHAAQGNLRIATESVPLSQVEQVWDRPDIDGRRVVLVP